MYSRNNACSQRGVTWQTGNGTLTSPLMFSHRDI
jgi:hypothetical protein